MSSETYIYKNIGGNSFSDFVGIKKDNITNGGVQSPGLIFYDAVENAFFGYRYTYGGHKKGEVKPDLNEFENKNCFYLLNIKDNLYKFGISQKK